MSELNVGISIYEGYAALLRELMSPHFAREVFWGGKYTVKQMR
jgi:enoyl-CoA hydratase/carnithine racemase